MAGAQTPRNDAAHDVLAAEAFALPAPDPALHHGPVVLPDDPTGIAEPHDVLAAEEFAMPAPTRSGGPGALLHQTQESSRSLVLGGVGAALFAWLLLRIFRRR